MDPRYAKEIEDGWAELFYKHVFYMIDEKRSIEKVIATLQDLFLP
jgi:hypothetical protein